MVLEKLDNNWECEFTSNYKIVALKDGVLDD